MMVSIAIMSHRVLRSIWVAGNLCLSSICLAAEPSNQKLAETLLKALAETHESHPGLIRVDDVEDLASGKQYRLCMVQGGPTINQDGGLGLFTHDDALLSTYRLKGLEDGHDNSVALWRILDHPKKLSLLPQAIKCSVLTGAGTGSWSTDYVILAPVNGKLVQLLRCEGNQFHWIPGGDGNRREHLVVTLALVSRDDAYLPSDLVRMAYHEIDGRGTSQSTAFRYDQTGPAYKQVPSLKETGGQAKQEPRRSEK